MVEKLDICRMNELSEYIVLDYLKQQRISPKNIICVDIEGLARDYFGLEVLFESIVEEDMGKAAFSANGERPLMVFRDGKPEKVIFTDKQIILDKYYKRSENYAARRFVLGHEVGHKILSQVAPEHAKGNYHVIFDSERIYYMDEIREMFHISETQANQMSAALLLPVFLLKATLKRVMNAAKFTVYGDYQMLPKDSHLHKQMADDLGVTTKTLFIRLKNCNLIEYRDIGEYAKMMLEKKG